MATRRPDPHRTMHGFGVVPATLGSSRNNTPCYSVQTWHYHPENRHGGESRLEGRAVRRECQTKGVLNSRNTTSNQVYNNLRLWAVFSIHDGAFNRRATMGGVKLSLRGTF